MSEPKTAQSPAQESRSSVWRWWKSLDSDRAGRAELRRCGTPAEVAFTAAYQRLLRMLGSRLGEGDARRVAVIAAVLSHIETEPAERATLARRMGSAEGGDSAAPVSDSRFRHIIRTDDPEELMRGLIRVVRQVGRTASVEPLFHDLMNWSEATRMRWANDYYEAQPRSKQS